MTSDASRPVRHLFQAVRGFCTSVFFIVGPISAQTRYATSVSSFSSEYNVSPGNWSAYQTVGAPNTYPSYGDLSTAWASLTADGQREFLELSYAFPPPSPITTVRIYETFNPGAVDTIYVRNPGTGEWEKVWEGTASPAPATARIFTANFPVTAFDVGQIRIALNSPAVAGWNEIDAVGISNDTDPTKYHGGPYDGHDDVIASLSNLDGVSPASAKFLGGSFDGFSEVTSAFGALDGTAPSTAKFFGGSYDGQDEEAGLFASLGGIPPDVAKFHGGSYDGHTMLSSILFGLNGGTPSSAKFHGGSYDGHFLTTSRELGFNGDTAILAKFYGGPYDGFAQLASIFGNLIGVSPTLSKYVGGNDDGHTLYTSGLTYFAGPPNPSKYLGGIDDGYTQSAGPFSNFAGLSPTIVKYAGGSGDGYGFEFSEIDISLPVELASFQVTVMPGRGAVRLQWRTESEIDNAYWLIMRRTALDSLRTVTQLRGMGTKASSTEYEWTDRELELDTLYYYRLADVSYDGSITHHDELAIRVDAPDEVELFGNFPNPFNPETSIRFALPRLADVHLVIYNALGQEVRVLARRTLPGGFHMLRWDGTNESGRFVSSGVYFYRLLIRLSNPPLRQLRTGRMMLVR